MICRPSFTILNFTTNKLNHLKRISPVLLNLFWRLNLELLETKAMRYQFYCLKVLKQALVEGVRLNIREQPCKILGVTFNSGDDFLVKKLSYLGR